MELTCDLLSLQRSGLLLGELCLHSLAPDVEQTSCLVLMAPCFQSTCDRRGGDFCKTWKAYIYLLVSLPYYFCTE